MSLTSEPAALDAFLRTVEQWRPQLEAELRLARQARLAVSAVEPNSDAAAHAERQLLRLVGVLETRKATAPAVQAAPSPGIFGRFWQRQLVLAAAATAAIILAAIVLSQPGGGGLAPTTAEAVVIEGSVAEVSADGVTINTDKGTRSFSLGGTTLQDGFGNTIDLSALKPGQIVVLIARPSDGVLVPQSLEVKGHLFGTITAVNAESVVIQAGQAQYVIRLSNQTKIEGRLVPGVYVEVDVERMQDGSFLAEEIEVEDRKSGEDDDSSGPGSGSSSDDDGDNSGPGGGGGDDDADNSGPGGGR